MKKDTGLLLSEVRGLLNNLNDNLSGDHGDYWVSALKKMLRKEEIPIPPKEVIEALKSCNFKKFADEKLEAVIRYIKDIPVVCNVERCEENDDDLINICIYPRLNMFLHGNKDTKLDTALFTLSSDGVIREVGGLDMQDMDKTFKAWEVDDWSLKGFINSLLELTKKYEEAVPQI